MTIDFTTALERVIAPTPGRDGEARYRVRAIEGTPHFIGKDSAGLACILLRSGIEAARAPIRLALLDVQFALQCRITDDAGRESTTALTVIACRSQDEALVRYFAHVAQTIVNIVGSAPSAAQVADVVHRLVELFQSLSRSTGRSVSGLFGELLLIHLSRAPRVAIRAWRSSIDDRFDFSTENVRVECKTASDRLRAHYFSREQCMPPEGTIGITFSMFVERSGGGTSVGELMSRIEVQLGGEAELILRLHATVAETLGVAMTSAMDMRFDEHLARSSLQLFDLRDVPAIRDRIPAEVSQVRFRSDISGLSPLTLAQVASKSARAADFLPGR